MFTPSRLVAPLCCGLWLALHPASQAAFPTTALKPVVLKQIHSPTNIVNAADGSGRLFVCDQPGVIYIIQGGMLLPAPFLDLSSQVLIHATIPTNYSERGLLGMAFHPGFSNSASPGYRKFYLYYSLTSTLPAGTDPVTGMANPVDHMTVLAEFQVSTWNSNVADPATERRLLSFNQPQNNHNGGQLEFGPDGYLYLGTGDGGGAQDNNGGHTGGTVATPRPTNNLGNGQDRTTFLGKILRINPLDPDGTGPLTYSLPGDNPFFSDPTPGLKKEIYAYGLRNPWRFSFDKRAGGTNRLFCGDVGQGRIEEINLITSGGNYGWRYKEGFELPTFSAGTPVPSGPITDPIAMYAHPGVVTSPVLPQLGLSVTGGFVYRGSAIPALQGKYVFGDYGSTGGASDGRLMGLEETALNSGVFTLTQAIPLVGSANPIVGQRILCLGEDESGEIYLGLKTKGGVKELDGGLPSGGIYKLVAPTTVNLTPIVANEDNTIFSDGEPTTANGNSNGIGSWIFAGYASPNGFQARRALLGFNLSSVPVGATITSALVKIFCDKQANDSPQSGAFSLFRVTADWGEGTSTSDAGTIGAGDPATPGDATWRLRVVTASGSPPTGTGWTTPGGDYNASASATTTVSGPNLTTPYIWSSAQNAQLAADANGWLATPGSNFGWILVGPEGGGATAKRFVSKDNSYYAAAYRPTLTLSYSSPPPPTRYETWLSSYFPTLLTGQYVGDVDGDGMDPQVEYAYGFNPTSFDAANNFSTILAPAAAGATDLTVTFRRDTAATDVTYRLQTSSGLSSNSWTTIAQSTAGAAPVGQNGGVIVSDVTQSGTIKLVTVRQTLPAGSNDKKFVRLKVDSP